MPILPRQRQRVDALFAPPNAMVSPIGRRPSWDADAFSQKRFVSAVTAK